PAGLPLFPYTTLFRSIEALHQEFGVSAEKGFVRTEINGLAFWRGRYAGKDIVVFRTGVSLVNAAYQLQLALDRFPITDVLFSGVDRKSTRLNSSHLGI